MITNYKFSPGQMFKYIRENNLRFAVRVLQVSGRKVGKEVAAGISTSRFIHSMKIIYHSKKFQNS